MAKRLLRVLRGRFITSGHHRELCQLLGESLRQRARSDSRLDPLGCPIFGEARQTRCTHRGTVSSSRSGHFRIPEQEGRTKPFLPASAHGTEVVLFPLVHCGDIEAGERAAAPVLRFGDALGSALGPTPYAGIQTAFDPLLTPGSRNYRKTHNFATLSDASLDRLIELARRPPGPECEIFVASLRGAMDRVPRSATPNVGRNARYSMNAHGPWSDPADDRAMRTWARQVFEQLAPYATGNGYSNFLTEGQTDRVAASYGENYQRAGDPAPRRERWRRQSTRTDIEVPTE
jgi:hypothetical protein